ncbi:MAG: nucleoside triphosphate pyrophosphohydrolase [Hyphomicrobiales bacterium]|nr:MAG: nucleoside triphosphate pyrophosphohydrolase [Hyphomicrobiales bacterium]
MTDAARDNLTKLLDVMAALRTPGTGCPWDLEQTFETIAPYTIEEAYEVADAIALKDLGALKDELGDLLLQVVYHARIAEEQGAFDFAQVAAAITAKMIRRHPHVFGTPEERAAGAAPGFWERLKAIEKAERAMAGDGTPPLVGSKVLADVPLALPALTRAVKLQAKAARVGFDWPSIAPVFDKTREELSELEEAIAKGEIGTDDAIAEELGDLMFVMANIARHLKVDPETALRKANEKFVRRFAHIEAALAKNGRTPEQSDLAEMDRLWDEAKAHERGKPPST